MTARQKTRCRSGCWISTLLAAVAVTAPYRSGGLARGGAGSTFTDSSRWRNPGRAQVAVSTLRKIESCRVVEPGYFTVLSIADALGVAASDLKDAAEASGSDPG